MRSTLRFSAVVAATLVVVSDVRGEGGATDDESEESWLVEPFRQPLWQARALLGSSLVIAGNQVRHEKVHRDFQESTRGGRAISDFERPAGLWLFDVFRIPVIGTALLMGVFLLVFGYPLSKLAAYIRRVGWLNREVVAPWVVKREEEQRRPWKERPAEEPEPEEAPKRSILVRLVLGELGGYVFLILMSPALVAVGCCFYGMLCPEKIVSEYVGGFRALCVFGLIVSLVGAGVCWLWLEKKMGYR